MASIQDERGYNQGYRPSRANDLRLKRRASKILDQMEGPAIRILELGCGTGELAAALARAPNTQVTAVDLSEKFVQTAQREHGRSNLSFVVEDFMGETRALTPASFDYVVGNGILHHLYSDMEGSLKKIGSLLKPGGGIRFWEPNIYNPYCALIFKIPFLRKVAKLEPTEMAFSRKYISDKLKRSGYRAIEVDYRDFLLPNTPDPLISLVVKIGDALEKITPINRWAQSLFISAKKGDRPLA